MGTYDDLKDRYQADKIVGSPSYVVMPGLVNDHFHVGLTPFQLGAPDLPLELWGLSRMRAIDVDPYLDQLYGAIPEVESHTTLDLQVSYNLNDNLRVTVGALNVTDEDPPWSDSESVGYSYGTAGHSPVGTVLYGRVAVRF